MNIMFNYTSAQAILQNGYQKAKAEKIEQNKRSKIIREHSDIWNCPSSKSDIYQYINKVT